MLHSVTRIKPSFEEFTAGIAYKEYDIALGLDMQIDVTDFRLISYEEIYRRIVEYQNRKTDKK